MRRTRNGILLPLSTWPKFISMLTTCPSAYIAASRRSDRSLEARVESARRASEIHKKRTGRSLRVTEQDVVNEEMYEEEDDDLPVQYRRLTSHLQTGSADFNRRLSAYLTSHVAMRSALDHAITNSYAQQYPNAPQFAHNQQTFPSPFPPPLPQTSSPHAQYGQPYPTPGTSGYRPGHQVRRASHSVAPSRSSFSPNMPTPSSAPGSALLPQRHTSLSSNSTSHSSSNQTSNGPQTPSFPEQSEAEQSANTSKSVHASPLQQHSSFQHLNGYPNMSPFSMALPMESQMLLNGALDPNDPMTAALMSGYDSSPFPYDGSHPAQPYSKSRSYSHPVGGMSTTLAPSAFDLHPRTQDANQQPTVNGMPASSAATPGTGYEQGDFGRGGMFPQSQSSQGSGTVTPGLDGWDTFINDTSWNDSNVT